MKKTLLFSAAIVASCSVFAAPHGFSKSDKSSFTEGPKVPSISKSQTLTRADGAMESFDFTYAGDPASAYSLNGVTGGVTRVYLGFQMAAEDVKTFAGSNVTDFTVLSATSDNNNNTITEGRFFCFSDKSENIYTQDFTISKTAAAENKVKMETPYVISGDEEYIVFGYSFVVPKKNNMYYLITDGIVNSQNTGLYSMSNDDNFPAELYSFADQIGALYMTVTLERENLPKYVNFTSFPVTMALPLGAPTAYPLTLKATSGAPIENVTIEYSFGGKPYECNFVFDPAVSAGASRYLGVALEFPAMDAKINEDVEFKLTKINGLANTGEYASASARVAVVDEVPARQTLVEEYTGTWCPWCTRGYAAMEYFKQNYPEFVTAAYHNEDPMAVVTQGYPAAISGFPSASLNRVAVYDPYYGSESFDYPVPMTGDILAFNTLPTSWTIGVSHEWESDDVLVVKSKAANVAGFKDAEFEIAYLLIADGLSGTSSNWFQANNYASQNPQYVEELNAFCRGGVYGKAKVGGLIFNDVVISPNGIYGMPNSIPSEVEPYETVEHSVKYDLSKIPSYLIADKNKLRVVAAIVDQNGEVLNCAKDEVNDFVDTGVDGIEDSDAPVEYYNLNGMKIAQPTQGVFIRRQGPKADKVLIK